MVFGSAYILTEVEPWLNSSFYLHHYTDLIDKTGIIIACIQGDKELNLKSLAVLSKNKKVEMVPLKEIQPLTGYIRGGVSPVGLKKNYPVFISSDIIKQEKVAVSAGLRGLQIFLSPLDLISVTKAQLAEISD